VVGATFSVNIYQSSVDLVNVVQPDLTYNTAVLQLTGFACNSAAFEFALPGSCGTATPKSGSQLVGTATFKALSAGAGTINFATSSHIYSSANVDVWDGSVTGSTVTVAVQQTVPAPAPTPAASAPSNSGTPTASGTTQNGGSTSANSGTTPPAPATSTPGTTTPAVAGSSTTQHIATYAIAVKVVDNRGSAIQGAAVTMYEKTSTTNNKGVASFSGIKAGKVSVVVVYKGNTTVVTANISKEGQQVLATIAVPKRGNWFIFAATLTTGVSSGLLFANRKRISSKINSMKRSKTADVTI
jgi:hypothetical protein